MKKMLYLVLSAALLGGCAVHGFRSDFQFAHKLAREGLWQEAVYRLERARAAGDDSAALHNNLAVALESLGRYDEAERAYEAALQRAPNSEPIQRNFRNFKKNLGKDADEKK